MCIECGRDKPSLKVIVGISVWECCGKLGWGGFQGNVK